MKPQSRRPSVVLIVDDEQEIADLYAKWLSSAYTTRIAYDGETAMAKLDDSVAVTLLDRQMPDISGDEVLSYIRQQERDCRVAMVTAVEPGVDIIEMGFDDYLLKPITVTELTSTVDQLMKLATYDSELREYYALARKAAALQRSTAEDDRPIEEIEALQIQLKDRRATLDNELEQIADVDARSLFRGIGRDGEG